MPTEATDLIKATLMDSGFPLPSQVSALRGDASTRGYFSVSLPPDRVCGLPEKLIAMLLPPDSDALFDRFAGSVRERAASRAG